ncbi:MAG: hypothetical protein QE271_03730 [Bacteriovoracaceae bacterium]|nr:hypothetical protein [Bacteriovoracaceae bacterium]
MDETPAFMRQKFHTFCASRMFTFFTFFSLLTTWLMLNSNSVFAINLMGRLGLGATSQLANGITGLSFKVQNQRESAWGGVLGLNSNSDSTDFGVGPKFYRLLFDEPHLNFYASLFAAYLRKNDLSGHQIDGTMGSEFHIPGIESVGISLEGGLSWNKVKATTSIETMAVASIHFYL